MSAPDTTSNESVTRWLCELTAEILACDDDEVTPSVMLVELGGASLDALQLILEVEDQTGVVLELDSVVATPIADLALAITDSARSR